jgi:hypothetical protein
MSNRLIIESTTFTYLERRTGLVHRAYGYRIADDYGKGFVDTFDSLEDAEDYVNTPSNLVEILEEHNFEIDPNLYSVILVDDNEVTLEGENHE